MGNWLGAHVHMHVYLHTNVYVHVPSLSVSAILDEAFCLLHTLSTQELR